MSDPLAGQREALNEGGESLLWPSIHPETGAHLPCPVQRGDTFELRTCRITITKVHRLGRAQDWQWRAEFMRTKRVTADRLYLLDKRGGYTNDPRQSIRAPEQHDAATIDGADWHEIPESLGPPTEPEAVPPEIVAELPLTVSARHRYEAEQHERRREFEELPLWEKVRRLELGSPEKVGRQLARIAEAAKAAERKLARHGESTEEAA